MSRWDALFADLEAQLAAEEARGSAGEVDARTRGELAEVTVLDRLRAALDHPVRCAVAGGLTLVGTLTRVGADFVVVREGGAREALVPAAALRQVSGLNRWAEPAGAVTTRLGLRSALRAVARDRSAVRVHLVDGEVVDATLDRVGADHVDLAVHAAGELRRSRDVRGGVVVPFSAVAAVRRDAVDDPDEPG